MVEMPRDMREGDHVFVWITFEYVGVGWMGLRVGRLGGVYNEWVGWS